MERPYLRGRRGGHVDTDLLRPEDVNVSRDEMVAGAFLAAYRDPTRSMDRLNLRQWFQWC